MANGNSGNNSGTKTLDPKVRAIIAEHEETLRAVLHENVSYIDDNNGALVVRKPRLEESDLASLQALTAELKTLLQSMDGHGITTAGQRHTFSATTYTLIQDALTEIEKERLDAQQATPAPEAPAPMVTIEPEEEAIEPVSVPEVKTEVPTQTVPFDPSAAKLVNVLVLDVVQDHGQILSDVFSATQKQQDGSLKINLTPLSPDLKGKFSAALAELTPQLNKMGGNYSVTTTGSIVTIPASAVTMLEGMLEKLDIQPTPQPKPKEKVVDTRTAITTEHYTIDVVRAQLAGLGAMMTDGLADKIKVGLSEQTDISQLLEPSKKPVWEKAPKRTLRDVSRHIRDFNDFQGFAIPPAVYSSLNAASSEDSNKLQLNAQTRDVKTHEDGSVSLAGIRLDQKGVWERGDIRMHLKEKWIEKGGVRRFADGHVEINKTAFIAARSAEDWNALVGLAAAIENAPKDGISLAVPPLAFKTLAHAKDGSTLVLDPSAVAIAHAMGELHESEHDNLVEHDEGMKKARNVLSNALEEAAPTPSRAERFRDAITRDRQLGSGSKTEDVVGATLALGAGFSTILITSILATAAVPLTLVSAPVGVMTMHAINQRTNPERAPAQRLAFSKLKAMIPGTNNNIALVQEILDVEAARFEYTAPSDSQNKDGSKTSEKDHIVDCDSKLEKELKTYQDAIKKERVTFMRELKTQSISDETSKELLNILLEQGMTLAVARPTPSKFGADTIHVTKLDTQEFDPQASDDRSRFQKLRDRLTRSGSPKEETAETQPAESLVEESDTSEETAPSRVRRFANKVLPLERVDQARDNLRTGIQLSAADLRLQIAHRFPAATETPLGGLLDSSPQRRLGFLSGHFGMLEDGKLGIVSGLDEGVQYNHTLELGTLKYGQGNGLPMIHISLTPGENSCHLPNSNANNLSNAIFNEVTRLAPHINLQQAVPDLYQRFIEGHDPSDLAVKARAATLRRLVAGEMLAHAIEMRHDQLVDRNRDWRQARETVHLLFNETMSRDGTRFVEDALSQVIDTSAPIQAGTFSPFSDNRSKVYDDALRTTSAVYNQAQHFVKDRDMLAATLEEQNKAVLDAVKSPGKAMETLVQADAKRMQVNPDGKHF